MRLVLLFGLFLIGKSASGGVDAQPAVGEGKCPVPTEVPGHPNWGPASKVEDLDASRFERRYGEKFQGVRQSYWHSPAGDLRYLCLDLKEAGGARRFFEKRKALASGDEILLRKGRYVTVVTLANERFLLEAAEKMEAEERYGPGKAFRELDLPAEVFPPKGNLIKNPLELRLEAFEEQEGGVALLAVRSLMYQSGPRIWVEGIFLVPGRREDMPKLLDASLRFRQKANGHVVDFVTKDFLLEVIGATPQLVDETASRIEKLHPDWKKHSDTESGK